jgi:hypothetical protein
MHVTRFKGRELRFHPHLQETTRDHLRASAMAISTAPPPDTSVELKTTLSATDMGSARLRSISF